MASPNVIRKALIERTEYCRRNVGIAQEFGQLVEDVGIPWVVDSLDLDNPNEYNPELAYRKLFVDENMNFAEEMLMNSIENFERMKQLSQLSDQEIEEMILKQAGKV